MKFKIKKFCLLGQDVQIEVLIDDKIGISLWGKDDDLTMNVANENKWRDCITHTGLSLDSASVLLSYILSTCSKVGN